MAFPLDLSGKEFGRWLVIGPAPGRSKNRGRLWFVKCRCIRGTCRTLTTSELGSGSRSCGCLRSETLAERNRNWPRDHNGKKIVKRKQPQACAHCSRDFTPLRSGRKYCSESCRGHARWLKIAADPRRKAAHSAYVTAGQKRATHINHEACAQCGKPFVGPPRFIHCSDACIRAAIKTGKYRFAYQRNRALIELAQLNAELQEKGNGKKEA